MQGKTHLCIPPTTSMPPSRRLKNTSRHQATCPDTRAAAVPQDRRWQTAIPCSCPAAPPAGAPTVSLQFAVICFFEVGDADQPAVIAVGPTVIGACEGGGVAGIRSAQAVAAMTADIQEGVNLPRAVAHHQDRVFAHIGRENVPGGGIWVSWHKKSQQRAKICSSSCA